MSAAVSVVVPYYRAQADLDRLTAALAAVTLASCLAATSDQLEVDLAFIQIDAHDTHLDAVAKAETATATLTGETVMQRVEVVVVARHRRDMHQALNIDVGQLDEQAEAGDRGDHTGEGLADAILHELALEPVDHVTGRLVGAPLGHRALLAELLQRRLVDAEELGERRGGQGMMQHHRALPATGIMPAPSIHSPGKATSCVSCNRPV